MLIDITLKITPKLAADDPSSKNPVLAGHLGTHFDVMHKQFPLAYTERKGIVFDVSGVSGRDITIGDIALDRVEKDMFVAFYTGFIEKVGYGGSVYFKEHPQLSDDLIDALLSKGISIIGIDFAGIRRTPQHIQAGYVQNHRYTQCRIHTLQCRNCIYHNRCPKDMIARGDGLNCGRYTPS